MAEPDPPPFVTTSMLAGAFGVVPKTISEWETKGKLPAALRGPDGSSGRLWPTPVAVGALRAAGYPVPARWLPKDGAA